MDRSFTFPLLPSVQSFPLIKSKSQLYKAISDFQYYSFSSSNSKRLRSKSVFRLIDWLLIVESYFHRQWKSSIISQKLEDSYSITDIWISEGFAVNNEETDGIFPAVIAMTGSFFTHALQPWYLSHVCQNVKKSLTCQLHSMKSVWCLCYRFNRTATDNVSTTFSQCFSGFMCEEFPQRYLYCGWDAERKVGVKCIGASRLGLKREAGQTGGS